MGAYLFWYKIDAYSRTEYIYIIAVSEKQAFYFLKSNGYTHCYDFSQTCEGFIGVADFTKKHQIGDILGVNAVI